MAEIASAPSGLKNPVDPAMQLVRNVGADRVVDVVRSDLRTGSHLDLVTSTLSLLAFAELPDCLAGVVDVRLLLPPVRADLALGTAGDPGPRDMLQARWLATRPASWIVEVRRANALIPQGAATVKDTIANEVTARREVLAAMFNEAAFEHGC